MKKIPIIINIDGGIVETVNSPVELNIMVLDYDKNGNPKLSVNRRENTPPENWIDIINEIRSDLTKHGEHDIDLKQFSDILTTYHLPVIEKIKIKTYYDECTDTSHLGEFTDDIDPDDLKRGSAFLWKPGNRNEYKYFKAATTVEEHREGLHKIGCSRQAAEDLARAYCRQSFTRVKGLNSGDWCYIGIMAEATIKTPTYSPGCYRLETFTSGGLWGIESDAGEKHIKEIQTEELEDLKRHLSDYGVNLDNWKEIAPEATGEIEDIDTL